MYKGGEMKVFIGGSRNIKELDENVVRALFDELNSGSKILVGDADGVDTEIQKFCNSQNYNNIVVYASNGKARNNAGNFEIKKIPVSKDTFSKQFFVAKDIAMTNDADYGIVIWDGKSKGSLDQLHRMVRQNKPCHVYIAGDKRWVEIESENTIKGISSLRKTLTSNSAQLSFI
jgi:hypothetical protein